MFCRGELPLLLKLFLFICCCCTSNASAAASASRSLTILMQQHSTSRHLLLYSMAPHLIRVADMVVINATQNTSLSILH